jgi:hypothetical protein
VIKTRTEPGGRDFFIYLFGTSIKKAPMGLPIGAECLNELSLKMLRLMYLSFTEKVAKRPILKFIIFAFFRLRIGNFPGTAPY